MSDFGFWYPRGTTNSEYGKFSYFSNLQGQSPSQTSFDVTGKNSQWNGQAYQNYQNPNQTQQHQHHPSCPNGGGQDQWMQQGWGQDGTGAGESDQPFTVHVGEEAATAALGGKANFQAHFNMPQNPCVSEPGAGGGLQYRQQQQPMAEAHNQVHGSDSMNMQNNDSMANKVQFDSNSQTGQGSSQEQFGGGDAVATDGTYNNGTSDQTTAGESNQQEQSPSAAAQALAAAGRRKPAKWKGLNNVKYGRQIPPSYPRQNQNQMTEMQMQMQNMQINPQQDQGQNMMYMNQPQYYNGGNNDQMNTSNVSMPDPSGASPPMTIPNDMKSSKSKPQRSQAKPQEKPSLCGKCTKCKKLFPESDGPSKVTFATTSSSHAIRQRNTRSLLNMGQQDAKNFRAIRYHNNS